MQGAGCNNALEREQEWWEPMSVFTFLSVLDASAHMLMCCIFALVVFAACSRPLASIAFLPNYVLDTGAATDHTPLANQSLKPIWLENTQKANEEQKDGAALSEKVLLHLFAPHPRYAQRLEKDGQAPQETLNDQMS